MNKGPTPGQGSGVKRRMQKKDFDKRNEWVTVMDNISDLGEEAGSSKAVQAGVSPQGNEFLWCLLRGKKTAEGEEPVIFAVDGTCRLCQFPLLNSNINEEATELTCGLCATSWSLDDGKVVDFLPAANPVQWAAKMANEKKGEVRLGILPTRVSKSGRVYLRLPDGTLTSKLPPKDSD